MSRFLLFKAAFFGAASGITVGVLGVVLYCLLINGLRGLPGWAAGNLVIGLAVGLTCSFTRKMENAVLRNIIIAIAVVLSTAIGILGIKSIVEVILYAQPMIVRVREKTSLAKSVGKQFIPTTMPVSSQGGLSYLANLNYDPRFVNSITLCLPCRRHGL